MHMGKTGRRLGLLLHRSQIEAKEPPDDLIVVQRGQPAAARLVVRVELTGAAIARPSQ